jgi:succinate dehydrogenase / fumarate reductase cytochrome b subunit
MTTRTRPLSPHLQVYRLPLAAVLSISHRATGVFLTIGTLLLAYWLAAAAYGPDSYARAQAFIGSWFGILLLLGWSFSLFFHLSNGIRHLVWDAGFGFEKHQYRQSNLIVLGAAGVLTLIAWVAGFAAL